MIYHFAHRPQYQSLKALHHAILLLYQLQSVSRSYTTRYSLTYQYTLQHHVLHTGHPHHALRDPSSSDHQHYYRRNSLPSARTTWELRAPPAISRRNMSLPWRLLLTRADLLLQCKRSTGYMSWKAGLPHKHSSSPHVRIRCTTPNGTH